jgi:O-6-methylguanine DNA methyltransferase
MNTTITANVESPIGPLRLIARNGELTGMYMEAQRHAPPLPDAVARDDDWFADIASQLAAYFRGDLTVFNVAMNLQGTDFQCSVWKQLSAIPYGETISYGELARRIGNPNASRAVGLANGRNPLSIIVPCHRVIGANGSLTGYGGGLERKTWLLQHESTFRN